MPLTEDSALRRERYPHKGLGLPVVPDDYEKLGVEERWRTRRAVVLRLPLIYGPHKLAAVAKCPSCVAVAPGEPGFDRRRQPVRTRGYVDDLATGVLSALGTRAADGLASTSASRRPCPPVGLEQIVRAAESDVELIRSRASPAGGPRDHRGVCSAPARLDQPRGSPPGLGARRPRSADHRIGEMAP